MTASAEGGNPIFPPFYATSQFLDCDTPLSPQSLDAASKFCRAATQAVVIHKRLITIICANDILLSFRIDFEGYCHAISR